MVEGVPDPTFLYRLRDGVYAADLLIAAVAGLDLFSWLAAHGPVPAADLRDVLRTDPRPGPAPGEAASRTGRAGSVTPRSPNGSPRPWTPAGPSSPPALAAAVADVPVSALLDVGGSSGVYSAAVLADRPTARTVVGCEPVDVAARTSPGTGESCWRVSPAERPLRWRPAS